MLLSSKGCQFEHTELSIHFDTFNDECAIVKESQDAYRLSQGQPMICNNNYIADILRVCGIKGLIWVIKDLGQF